MPPKRAGPPCLYQPGHNFPALFVALSLLFNLDQLGHLGELMTEQWILVSNRLKQLPEVESNMLIKTEPVFV